MPASPKETPASGSNHPAGVNTQNTPEIISEILRDAQRFARLQATAAIAGQSLQQSHDGYTLSRKSHSRHCANLDTVAALLQRMGQQQANPSIMHPVHD